MALIKLIERFIKKFLELLQDFLAPEDIKIQKLLDLPAGAMRELLPKSPVYMKDIFVLFDYQNKIIRFMVKSIKYKNNANLRKRLANYLYEEIIEISADIALFEGQPPILLPMPMSKIEKRKRGFNQCEELVREIKKMGGNNIEVSYHSLKKIRETERQTKLDRSKREKNVKNSMTVPTASVGAVRNRIIIVLDDVYTTGASFSEARRALLSASARRVIGFFIAH